MAGRRDPSSYMGTDRREGEGGGLNPEGMKIEVLPTASFLSGNRGGGKSPLLRVGHQKWQRSWGKDSMEPCPEQHDVRPKSDLTW